MGTISSGMAVLADLRRFVRFLPVVLVAAVVAEIVGSAPSIVAASNDSMVALLQRVLYDALAAATAGSIMSIWFVGRPIAVPEWTLALVAATMSLVLGPRIQSLIGGWAYSSEIWGPLGPTDIVWSVAILLLLAPGQFIIWRQYSDVRVRDTDRTLWRRTHQRTSADISLIGDVDRGCRLLRRQETERTSALVAALLAWFSLWARSPGGVPSEAGWPLVRQTDAEMRALFGDPQAKVDGE
jgi:hypothetical protein